MITTATIQISPEIMSLVAGIDEFKGAWRTLSTLALDRLHALLRMAMPWVSSDLSKVSRCALSAAAAALASHSAHKFCVFILHRRRLLMGAMDTARCAAVATAALAAVSIAITAGPTRRPDKGRLVEKSVAVPLALFVAAVVCIKLLAALGLGNLASFFVAQRLGQPPP